MGPSGTRRGGEESPESRRICDACGAANAATATTCSKCHGTRWAPGWVRELRRVNRSFAVQVTDSHPLSDSSEPRLTLYKWWPGNKATFNIKNAAQWDAVKTIVDTDLARFLGWSSAQAIREELDSRQSADATTDAKVRELAKANPRLLTEIVKGIEPERITEEDLPQLGQALGEIADILLHVDESHRAAISQLVKRLPRERAQALRQLTELMEELTIGQIAAVTNEVRRRVGLLELFKQQVLDERTYELTGENSIHRLLERAMWIVDERYWLMHSNRQLRTVVTKQLEAQDKDHERKRPDFVCGTVDKRLIVIEIKRPSHTLDVEDLNQLERYVVLCKKYNEDIGSFEALLVGHAQSDELHRTLAVRGGGFKVRTYTQLVDDTERRYHQYLKALSDPN
jgi:hypothetical protein